MDFRGPAGHVAENADGPREREVPGKVHGHAVVQHLKFGQQPDICLDEISEAMHHPLALVRREVFPLGGGKRGARCCDREVDVGGRAGGNRGDLLCRRRVDHRQSPAR